MSENENTAQQNQEAASTEAAATQTAENQGTVPGTAETQQQPSASENAEGDQASNQSEPIKYEFKHPVEGAEFNPLVVDKFSKIAGKYELSQEAAQEIMGEMTQTLNEVQAEALSALRAQWQADVTADKEIGGDKLNESMAVAKKALDHFGGDDVRQLLNETGFGDHPAVIRMFNKIGKAISEDSFVNSSQRAASQQTPAKSLYPNMN